MAAAARRASLGNNVLPICPIGASSSGPCILLSDEPGHGARYRHPCPISGPCPFENEASHAAHYTHVAVTGPLPLCPVAGGLPCVLLAAEPGHGERYRHLPEAKEERLVHRTPIVRYPQQAAVVVQTPPPPPIVRTPLLSFAAPPPVFTTLIVLDFSRPNQIRLDLRRTNPPLPTAVPDPHMTIFFRDGRTRGGRFTHDEQMLVQQLTNNWVHSRGGRADLKFTLQRWGPQSDRILGDPQELYMYLCQHAKLEQGRCTEPHVRLR